MALDDRQIHFFYLVYPKYWAYYLLLYIIGLFMKMSFAKITHICTYLLLCFLPPTIFWL